MACRTVLGAGNSPDSPGAGSGGIETPPATLPPGSANGDDTSMPAGSEFPMPADAANVVNVDGDLNFQTKLSLQESMNYYRDQFGKSGCTERSGLTVQDKSRFSMVFDGHKSGQAIVVQGVDLGNGTVNINISLRDA